MHFFVDHANCQIRDMLSHLVCAKRGLFGAVNIPDWNLFYIIRAFSQVFAAAGCLQLLLGNRPVPCGAWPANDTVSTTDCILTNALVQCPSTLVLGIHKLWRLVCHSSLTNTPDVGKLMVKTTVLSPVGWIRSQQCTPCWSPGSKLKNTSLLISMECLN